MNNMTSYDENGPIIPVGNVRFSASTDLPGGRHTFEVPTFNYATDESVLIVEFNGVHLFKSSTFNDHYGFGSSPDSALRDCLKTIQRLEGCNADISIVSTIKIEPCIIADEKPFYCGAQRVHHIPWSWHDEDEKTQKSEQEFLVWQNGGPTGDTARFLDAIADLASQDAAPARKGDMCTVLNRKHNAATPDTFMRTPEATQ